MIAIIVILVTIGLGTVVVGTTFAGFWFADRMKEIRQLRYDLDGLRKTHTDLYNRVHYPSLYEAEEKKRRERFTTL